MPVTVLTCSWVALRDRTCGWVLGWFIRVFYVRECDESYYIFTSRWEIERENRARWSSSIRCSLRCLGTLRNPFWRFNWDFIFGKLYAWASTSLVIYMYVARIRECDESYYIYVRGKLKEKIQRGDSLILSVFRDVWSPNVSIFKV